MAAEEGHVVSSDRSSAVNGREGHARKDLLSGERPCCLSGQPRFFWGFWDKPDFYMTIFPVFGAAAVGSHVPFLS